MQYIIQKEDNDGSKIEKLETMNWKSLEMIKSNLKCKDICLADTLICAESFSWSLLTYVYWPLFHSAFKIS